MKILIFNTLYYPDQVGGAEVSVQILAEKLALKNEVTVISIGENSEKFIHNGVSVIKWSCKLPPK
ncbi:hypothetical protein GOQ04_24775 [Emticicia sp. ODNR4P]|nr:hypothetical protein [Emticicia sp. ODNR4P]